MISRGHSPRRLISIDAGLVMVVTDIHGDWELYTRCRDIFLAGQARGELDHLIIAGDFIHSDDPTREHSLQITLDLMAMKRELGPRLIVLLGNHEMAHIYHIVLARGRVLYTPAFERAMGEHREAILDFFASLPFYVRTRSGVAIGHAGGFPEAREAAAMEQLLTLSHREVLARVEARWPPDVREALRAEIASRAGVPYALLAKRYMAVENPDDPRYDDYLIGQLVSLEDEFTLLWSALFTKNERQYGEAYFTYLDALLKALSAGYAQQRVMITGHVGCDDGYLILGCGRQFRIASGKHATPVETGRYLIFDAAQPVKNAQALMAGLKSVWPQ